MAAIFIDTDPSTLTQAQVENLRNLGVKVPSSSGGLFDSPEWKAAQKQVEEQKAANVETLYQRYSGTTPPTSTPNPVVSEWEEYQRTKAHEDTLRFAEESRKAEETRIAELTKPKLVTPILTGKLSEVNVPDPYAGIVPITREEALVQLREKKREDRLTDIAPITAPIYLDISKKTEKVMGGVKSVLGESVPGRVATGFVETFVTMPEFIITGAVGFEGVARTIKKEENLDIFGKFPEAAVGMGGQMIEQIKAEPWETVGQIGGMVAMGKLMDVGAGNIERNLGTFIKDESASIGRKSSKGLEVQFKPPKNIYAKQTLEPQVSVKEVKSQSINIYESQGYKFTEISKDAPLVDLRPPKVEVVKVEPSFGSWESVYGKFGTIESIKSKGISQQPLTKMKVESGLKKELKIEYPPKIESKPIEMQKIESKPFKDESLFREIKVKSLVKGDTSIENLLKSRQKESFGVDFELGLFSMIGLSKGFKIDTPTRPINRSVTSLDNLLDYKINIDSLTKTKPFTKTKTKPVTITDVITIPNLITDTITEQITETKLTDEITRTTPRTRWKPFDFENLKIPKKKRRDVLNDFDTLLKQSKFFKKPRSNPIFEMEDIFTDKSKGKKKGFGGLW